MGKSALTRTNLMLDTGKLLRVRRTLRSRSNSEAVRRLIDEHLAAERGVQALKNLQKFGGLKDVFGRLSKRK
jgi:hypothetical protein